jgi:hypothetical protein
VGQVLRGSDWDAMIRLRASRYRPPQGPYSRAMPRSLWRSLGSGRFLMSEVPLYGEAIGMQRWYGEWHSAKLHVQTAHAHSLSLSRSHTHAHTHCLSLSHPDTHTLSLYHSLFLSHTFTHTHTHTNTRTLSLSVTHTHTHTHTHIHTHAHSLFLAVQSSSRFSPAIDLW